MSASTAARWAGISVPGSEYRVIGSGPADRRATAHRPNSRSRSTRWKLRQDVVERPADEPRGGPAVEVGRRPAHREPRQPRRAPDEAAPPQRLRLAAGSGSERVAPVVGPVGTPGEAPAVAQGRRRWRRSGRGRPRAAGLDRPGSSERRDATTQPAEPAPTTIVVEPARHRQRQACLIVIRSMMFATSSHLSIAASRWP